MAYFRHFFECVFECVSNYDSVQTHLCKIVQCILMPNLKGFSLSYAARVLNLWWLVPGRGSFGYLDYF